MTNNKTLFTITDNDGKIIELVHNNLIELDVGDLITHALGERHISKLLNFIHSVKAVDHAVLQHVEYEGRIIFMMGYKREQELFITMIAMTQDILIKELTMINSESINQDRALEEQIAQEVFVSHQEILEEVSRLNKELINAQRLMLKMNYELESKNDELERIAIHDNLTGLYNRVYLKTKFNELCILQQRLGPAISIAMIDLNNFKAVNDSYGHEEGDRLLVKFAEVGMNITRKDFDYFFRIGGDEFLIIMVECSVESAIKACSRLNDEFRKHTVVSSISYGVVALDMRQNEALEYYLSEADKRMDAHKKIFKALDNLGEKN